MEDTARPKRKRTRYTRGKCRRINLKGGSGQSGQSGQSTQTSTELVLWDSAVHTSKMENDEAVDPGMEDQHKISMTNVNNLLAACTNRTHRVDELNERIHNLHNKHHASLEQRLADTQAHSSDLTEAKLSECRRTAEVKYLQRAAVESAAAKEGVEARLQANELQHKMKMVDLKQQLEQAKSLNISGKQERVQILHNMEHIQQAHERTQGALQQQVEVLEVDRTALQLKVEAVEGDRTDLRSKIDAMEADLIREQLNILMLTRDKVEAERREALVLKLGASAVCVLILMIAVVLNLRYE